MMHSGVGSINCVAFAVVHLAHVQCRSLCCMKLSNRMKPREEQARAHVALQVNPQIVDHAVIAAEVHISQLCLLLQALVDIVFALVMYSVVYNCCQLMSAESCAV